MESKQEAPTTIDEYIEGFPPKVQELLHRIRAAIRSAAPDAEESISYGIPTFKLNGRAFIYFAGYKKHISVYPAPMGVEEFQEEIAAYGAGKGTFQFPLNKPIPFEVIDKVVRYRLRENQEKAAASWKK